MKSTRIFAVWILALGLLAAGCGGSGDPVIIGTPCVTDADCDDGDFCSGIERCLAGTCVRTPRCDTSDPCAPEVCVDTFAVQTCRSECAARGPGDACCGNEACAEKPVCAGQTYEFRVTNLQQAPASCLLNQALLDQILPLLLDAQYNVKLPLAESEFTTVEIALPVPVIGAVTVTAVRSGGELVFDPVRLDDIDLSSLGIPGVACRVGGTAAGFTSGFGNDSVQVTINLSEMSVAAVPGGLCLLPQPAGACVLDVTSVGQLFERGL